MKTKLLRKIRTRFIFKYYRRSVEWRVYDRKTQEHHLVYTLQDALFIMAKHFVNMINLERRLYDNF